MKKYLLLIASFLPAIAQTPVRTNPTGSGTTVQPSGTNLPANNFHADSFIANQATINSLNANNWVVPTAYGTASGGSTNTATATGSGTSVNFSATSDFMTKMGVMILHSGAACGSVLETGCASPPTPSVATSGTAGSTTYSYKLACIDGLGGVGVAGSAGSTSTGNARLAGVVVGTETSGNYNIVSWTAGTACRQVVIYRNNVLIAGAYSAPTGASTYKDLGAKAWTNRDIPATPLTTALNDNYIGMITALTGTTATLSPALGKPAVAATLYHSDTPLFQASISASKFIKIPVGTYLINYPINYTLAQGAGFAMGEPSKEVEQL